MQYLLTFLWGVPVSALTELEFGGLGQGLPPPGPLKHTNTRTLAACAWQAPACNLFGQSWQQQALLLPERGDGNNKTKKTRTSSTFSHLRAESIKQCSNYRLHHCSNSVHLEFYWDKGIVRIDTVCAQAPQCYSRSIDYSHVHARHSRPNQGIQWWSHPSSIVLKKKTQSHLNL